MKLPLVPFKVRDVGREESNKARPHQKETVSLPQTTGKDIAMKALYNIELGPNKIQNDIDSTQYVGDENEHTGHRARSESICSITPSMAAVDTFSRLLYNEAHCMKMMNFTRNHTFSFFKLHPVYEEHNKLFRKGADRGRITRYRPKVAKPVKLIDMEKPIYM